MIQTKINQKGYSTLLGLNNEIIESYINFAETINIERLINNEKIYSALP